MNPSKEDDGQCTKEEDPSPSPTSPPSSVPKNNEGSSRSAEGILDEPATKALEEHTTPPTPIQPDIPSSSASPQASVPQNTKAGLSSSEIIYRLVRFGFSEELVTRVVEENGEWGENEVTDYLFTYLAGKTPTVERIASAWRAVQRPALQPTRTSFKIEELFSDGDTSSTDISEEELQESEEDLTEVDMKSLTLEETEFLEDNA